MAFLEPEYLEPEYQKHNGSRKVWDELQQQVLESLESLEA
jgi:hypothetical protein